MSHSPESGLCAEKMSLLDLYEKTSREHLLALQHLNARMATLPKADYDDLRQALEKTRLIAEDARIALEHHARGHGC